MIRYQEHMNDRLKEWTKFNKGPNVGMFPSRLLAHPPLSSVERRPDFWQAGRPVWEIKKRGRLSGRPATGSIWREISDFLPQAGHRPAGFSQLRPAGRYRPAWQNPGRARSHFWSYFGCAWEKGLLHSIRFCMRYTPGRLAKVSPCTIPISSSQCRKDVVALNQVCSQFLDVLP